MSWPEAFFGAVALVVGSLTSLTIVSMLRAPPRRIVKTSGTYDA